MMKNKFHFDSDITLMKVSYNFNPKGETSKAIVALTECNMRKLL